MAQAVAKSAAGAGPNLWTRQPNKPIGPPKYLEVDEAGVPVLGHVPGHVVEVTASGALPLAPVVVLTGAAKAMTISDQMVANLYGTSMQIIDVSGAAHTVTTSGGNRYLAVGGASTDVATFNGTAGSNLTLKGIRPAQLFATVAGVTLA